MKEEIWNMEKGRFWRDEEAKHARKRSALKQLDSAIDWVGFMGEEHIAALVDDLDLPDTQSFWKRFLAAQKEEGSAFYRLGVVGLFRDVLLDSVAVCPVTHSPYAVNVIDTTVYHKVGIRCPIIDTSSVSMALVIDPVKKDTTYQRLKMSVVQKIFGGGEIKNHGFIDEEQKKSWEKRGR
jgi:hypothetical protein